MEQVKLVLSQKQERLEQVKREEESLQELIKIANGNKDHEISTKLELKYNELKDEHFNLLRDIDSLERTVEILSELIK